MLCIKDQESDKPRKKARFIILGYRDPDKGRIVNEAPTVSRFSVRLVVALSRMLDYPLWSRDVTQAFVQSKDNLKRELYMRVPKRQNVLETIRDPPHSVLKAIKTLYGLPESPTYWWTTFSSFYSKELGMEPAVLDPCLFYANNASTTNDKKMESSKEHKQCE